MSIIGLMKNTLAILTLLVSTTLTAYSEPLTPEEARGLAWALAYEARVNAAVTKDAYVNQPQYPLGYFVQQQAVPLTAMDKLLDPNVSNILIQQAQQPMREYRIERDLYDQVYGR